ncbi:MAG TPA: FkbM family methyltransferase [Rhodopila sp.]
MAAGTSRRSISFAACWPSGGPHFGDGVVALDCGAHVGIHTIEWAKLMTGWGKVIAFVAQERLFYALAGNIVINNCLNARAIHAVLGAQGGNQRVPVPDDLSPGSFGSLEMRQSATTEFIGQAIDYAEASMVEVPAATIDSLKLARVDLIKIDVEGMEADVLTGARDTLTAFRPIVVAEHLKVGWDALADLISPFGYRLFRATENLIAVHPDEPTIGAIRQG